MLTDPFPILDALFAQPNRQENMTDAQTVHLLVELKTYTKKVVVKLNGKHVRAVCLFVTK